MRGVNDFTKTKIKGAFDVKFIPSDKNEVTLKTDEEISKRILTPVEKGVLTIKAEKGFKNYQTISIEVRFKSIEYISVFGSGDVSTESFTAESFEFSSRGSGDAQLLITCTDLKVSNSGSGNCTLIGRAKTMNLFSFGSGNIHALDIDTENITIESKGSGNVDINASKSIKGTNVGSEDIECKGGATIEISNQVSGTVFTR